MFEVLADLLFTGLAAVRLPNLTNVDGSGWWIWQPVSAPVQHRIPSLDQELGASADRQQHFGGNMAERQIA